MSETTTKATIIRCDSRNAAHEKILDALGHSISGSLAAQLELRMVQTDYDGGEDVYMHPSLPGREYRVWC